jgi:hypothetical protein
LLFRQEFTDATIEPVSTCIDPDKNWTTWPAETRSIPP